MKLDLATRWLGRAHEHHARIGSTNDRAAQWARAGGEHGALVTADEQSAGRGRHGRAWHSPPRNLYASFILRPAPGTHLGALGLAVGVGLTDGLADLDLGLKWPNDIIAAGRKLGGILCESRWVGDAPEVVVGFGLNLGGDLPEDLREIAVSLAELGHSGERASVLAALLAALEPVLEGFGDSGFASCRDRYEARSTILGRRIELDAGAFTAEGFDDDGALLARPVAGGPQITVRSGDVRGPALAPGPG